MTGTIPHAEYFEFCRQFEEGKMLGYRWGQAFYNKFATHLPSPWSELFYCEDKPKAEALVQKYINWED